MSIRQVPMYQVICDWPGCGLNAHIDMGGDYSGWGDVAEARSEAENYDWWLSVSGGQDYCNKHPTVWASDHEDGEPFPEPPYLLIHDGDTDNPARDDGRVSLIQAALCERGGQ